MLLSDLPAGAPCSCPIGKFQFCVETITLGHCCLCVYIVVLYLLLCLSLQLLVQINVSTSLLAGGETGIFSPMHLLVFQKPEANGEGH